MEKALTSLPLPYQEALRLRLFEQLSLGEVARRIGVSLATAKKRVYLGARLYEEALREALGRSPEERGPGGGA